MPVEFSAGTGGGSVSSTPSFEPADAPPPVSPPPPPPPPAAYSPPPPAPYNPPSGGSSSGSSGSSTPVNDPPAPQQQPYHHDDDDDDDDDRGRSGGSDDTNRVIAETIGALTSIIVNTVQSALAQNAAAAEEEAAEVEPTVVEIDAGDTLWGLANEHYGDGRLWNEIADANQIEDPAALSIGTDLVIPDLEPPAETPIVIDTSTLVLADPASGALFRTEEAALAGQTVDLGNAAGHIADGTETLAEIAADNGLSTQEFLVLNPQLLANPAALAETADAGNLYMVAHPDMEALVALTFPEAAQTGPEEADPAGAETGTGATTIYLPI
ncbi:MAG: LysM peptidoglycan-binding domain-containing protein, partial [Hyphomicrobiaceae bacterium]|nr:LysM peptidoglycan-binding domain-containing protein [Hyphomicrobiaceae bacterium]